MKITVIGKDYKKVDEENFLQKTDEKIHLIKIGFLEPTKEKIDTLLTNYPKTNRFIIDNNIKIYNSILKNTTKKYYVENVPGTNIISFLRKNNKVMVNFNYLRDFEKTFLFSDGIFTDLLRNIEVLQISKRDFERMKKYLSVWDGNVIMEA